MKKPNSDKKGVKGWAAVYDGGRIYCVDTFYDSVERTARESWYFDKMEIIPVLIIPQTRPKASVVKNKK